MSQGLSSEISITPNGRRRDIQPVTAISGPTIKQSSGLVLVDTRLHDGIFKASLFDQRLLC